LFPAGGRRLTFRFLFPREREFEAIWVLRCELDLAADAATDGGLPGDDREKPART
jgi:hypothetical protein